MIKYLGSSMLLSLLVSLAPALGDTNLVKNPCFEDGTDGWSDRSCQIEAVSTPVHGCTKSARVFGRTETWQGIKQSLLGKVVNGQTYKVSAWVQLDNSEYDTIVMSIEQSDDNGTKYKTVARTKLNKKADWFPITGEFKVDTTGTVNTFDIYFEGPAVDVSFFVDDVVVSGPDASQAGQADPNAAKADPNAAKADPNAAKKGAAK